MRTDMKSRIRKSLWIGVAVLTATFSLPALAEEVITSYHVDAKVEPSSAVILTETIKVIAENRNINHGIYRDIPTIYEDRFGNKVSMPIDLLAIERDGESEPYHVANLDNGVRIYIGDKDKTVSFGPHTYTISYRVLHVIGYFEKGDELYWNVTGNGWNFPIERASVRIEFPGGSTISQAAAYTGAQGMTGKDFVQKWNGTVYEAATTRVLGSGEGLTVAAMIQKGVIHQPD